ncbi:MAG: isoprenylcysteine carboxylmethyltransferase family protein [Deltaproteobacteria bacterium]|nr:isoprenylcysteine carboxylmethyltransferase family protein [Deltaproteobacteria bacterium]
MGAAALAYGIVSYVVFLVSLLYAIGFVGNFVVPKSIDSGIAGPASEALLVDVLLLLAFAIPHSVMARAGFKRWWTRVVPKSLERSTYVLVSSLLLLLLYWGWQPIPGVVWQTENAIAVAILWALFWLGWALVLYSSFAIDHFDLFGLRQVWLRFRGVEYAPVPFEQPWLYTIVRHPLMLGFLLAFWAAPTLTQGHLLFSLATSGYILVGIVLEERDLVKAHGQSYVIYTREVRMLLPIPRRPSR